MVTPLKFIMFANKHIIDFKQKEYMLVVFINIDKQNIQYKQNAKTDYNKKRIDKG